MAASPMAVKGREKEPPSKASVPEATEVPNPAPSEGEPYGETVMMNPGEGAPIERDGPSTEEEAAAWLAPSDEVRDAKPKSSSDDADDPLQDFLKNL